MKVFNLLEGVFWIILAGVFLLIRKINIKTRATLAAFLIAFGISDFLEREAWWTPWWLLFYKAICLTVILFLFYKIIKREKL